MPLYTFICDYCKTEDDKLFISYEESIQASKEQRIKCPNCSKPMRRSSIQESAYTPNKWVTSVL